MGLRYVSLTAMAAAFIASAGTAQAQLEELRQPEQKRSEDRVLNMELRCRMDAVTVAGKTIQARLYNATMPSATMHVRAGDTLKIKLINDMPPNEDQELPDQGNYPQRINTTNIHTHGLNVEPDGYADNVLLSVLPGETIDYVIPIPSDHPAGSYWYHPHHHASTMPQVMSGMAGFIVVDDEMDKTPEDLYNIPDVQMIFQAVTYHPNTMTIPWPKRSSAGFSPYSGTVNTPIVVNGMEQAKLTLRPGEIRRLRMCNALNSDIVRIHLKRGQGDTARALDVTEIALDGIYLRRPMNRDLVELIPGDRSDILVQAPNDGAEYWVVMDHYDQSYRFKSTRDLVRLDIAGEPNVMQMPTALPASFAKGDIKASEVTGHRDVYFSMVNSDSVGKSPDTTYITRVFQVDSMPFNHDVVNMTLKAGDVEEWYITNNSRGFHPFHIHVNEFQVVGVRKLGSSDSTIIDEPVWNDVVMLDTMATTRIRMRLSDVSGKTVMHCHFLGHEDMGMMNVIDIVARTSAIHEAPWTEPELFPNPAVGRYTTVRIHVPDFLNGTPVDIAIHDITGAVVHTRTVTGGQETTVTLDVADLTAGTYYVLVRGGRNYHESSKLVLVR